MNELDSSLILWNAMNVVDRFYPRVTSEEKKKHQKYRMEDEKWAEIEFKSKIELALEFIDFHFKDNRKYFDLSFGMMC